MNIDDISDLLALCAEYDRRTISDETPKAWILLLGDIPAEDAASAVREHYRTTTQWIMPAHIVAHHEKLNAARAVEAMRQAPPPCPDPGCQVRYVLSGRPGSQFALPDDVHAAGCRAMQGVMQFDSRGPSWGVLVGMANPLEFDEVAYEAAAEVAAARMNRYRAITGGDPEYGPGADGDGR